MQYLAETWPSGVYCADGYEINECGYGFLLRLTDLAADALGAFATKSDSVMERVY